MNACAVRLRFVIVMLAWLAQALMPVVHAATTAGSTAAQKVWCGEHALALAALAVLPAELRGQLDEFGTAAEDLASCAVLCAAGTATTQPIAMAAVAVLRAAGLEPVPAPLNTPATRSQTPKPPAQAPPAHG